MKKNYLEELNLISNCNITDIYKHQYYDLYQYILDSNRDTLVKIKIKEILKEQIEEYSKCDKHLLTNINLRGIDLGFDREFQTTYEECINNAECEMKAKQSLLEPEVIEQLQEEVYIKFKQYLNEKENEKIRTENIEKQYRNLVTKCYKKLSETKYKNQNIIINTDEELQLNESLFDEFIQLLDENTFKSLTEIQRMKQRQIALYSKLHNLDNIIENKKNIINYFLKNILNKKIELYKYKILNELKNKKNRKTRKKLIREEVLVKQNEAQKKEIKEYLFDDTIMSLYIDNQLTDETTTLSFKVIQEFTEFMKKQNTTEEQEIIKILNEKRNKELKQKLIQEKILIEKDNEYTIIMKKDALDKIDGPIFRMLNVLYRLTSIYNQITIDQIDKQIINQLSKTNQNELIKKIKTELDSKSLEATEYHNIKLKLSQLELKFEEYGKQEYDLTSKAIIKLESDINLLKMLLNNPIKQTMEDEKSDIVESMYVTASTNTLSVSNALYIIYVLKKIENNKTADQYLIDFLTNNCNQKHFININQIVDNVLNKYIYMSKRKFIEESKKEGEKNGYTKTHRRLY